MAAGDKRASRAMGLRPFLGVGIVLGVAGLAWALGGRPPAWREVVPGAHHLPLPPADGDVELLRFDLARFRVEVAVPGPAQAQTAASALRDGAAVLAVNGGFFDTGGRSLGLRISDGKTLVRPRANVDWGVLLVRGGGAGGAEIVHTRDFQPDPAIAAAIQVGPRIVAAGRPLKLKHQVAMRTAIALDRAGANVTVAVTRRPSSAAAVARLLVRLGYWSAILLDGGPSTQLAAQVGALTLNLPGAYPVPDLLLIKPR